MHACDTNDVSVTRAQVRRDKKKKQKTGDGAGDVDVALDDVVDASGAVGERTVVWRAFVQRSAASSFMRN